MEEENNKGCTTKNSKGGRQPSTTWCCQRGRPHARHRTRAFAGLAWPVAMGPREWGLEFRGFAWTRSGVLKPYILRCLPIKTRHLFQIWHLGTQHGAQKEAKD